MQQITNNLNNKMCLPLYTPSELKGEPELRNRQDSVTFSSQVHFNKDNSKGSAHYGAGGKDSTLRIASYNVENLFDDIDDPEKKDEDTPAKSHEDMLKLALAIKNANADIISLQEVENIGILNSFLDKYLPGMYAHRALVEGNDMRGIDVAVISKYPIKEVVTHKNNKFPLPDGSKNIKFRRDLLRVDIQAQDKMVSVYSTHLKAHAGGDKADAIRLAEAREARRIILEEMKQYPQRHFVLTGDFNDHSQSEVGRVFLPQEGNLKMDKNSDYLSNTEPGKSEIPQSEEQTNLKFRSALEKIPPNKRVTHPATGRGIDYLLYPEHMHNSFLGGGIQYLPSEKRGSDHFLIYGDFKL